MARQRKKMTRLAAIELLVEAKVIKHEDRQWVCGDATSIEFSFGGIDADKKGFFNREDVCRLISYSRLPPV